MLSPLVTLHMFLPMCPTCQACRRYPRFTDKGSKAPRGKEIAEIAADHGARELLRQPPVVGLFYAAIRAVPGQKLRHPSRPILTCPSAQISEPFICARSFGCPWCLCCFSLNLCLPGGTRPDLSFLFLGICFPTFGSLWLVCDPLGPQHFLLWYINTTMSSLTYICLSCLSSL